MRQLRLVKGRKILASQERGPRVTEQKFRFPAEEIWELSCEDRPKPAAPPDWHETERFKSVG
jgi:hypothetical protein